MKISRILHAGYVFEYEEIKILFDPIFENPFSQNCYAFPEVRFDLEQIRKLKIDAIFISHFHDDHCSFKSLNILDRKIPIYVYCVHEELFSLIKKLGFVNVHSLQIDVPIHIEGFEVIPRRALDADVDSLFQIKAGDLNILNVVDSWIDPRALMQLTGEPPWDLVLWPLQTMLEIDVLSPSRVKPASRELPPEWMKQLKALSPRYVVPSSCQFVQEPWSWYNHAMFPISYAQFKKEIEQCLPTSQVIRLNPSVSIDLDQTSLKTSLALPWVQPQGEQNVDYEFRENLKIPSTAEISRRFAALTENQKQKVNEYCRSGLRKKYLSLEPAVDPFFDQQRLWRLTIYDHEGGASHFHYRIGPKNIDPIQKLDGRLSWCTEVPEAKLFAALERGESLTSMYLRINDMVFEPLIEKEMQDVDIVEDPLIRCLFNGVFAAYQKYQLKELRP